VDSKHILESRTFWFNLAAAVLPLLADNLALVRDYLPNGGYLVYMCLVSAGNVYLRTVTNAPVRLK
jgi:hypothetical protein